MKTNQSTTAVSLRTISKARKNRKGTKSALRRGILASSVAALLAVVAAAPSARAATLTWDIVPGLVGVGNGTISGGPGNWDLVTGNWTVDAGANNVAWTNGNDAIFQGATGTVTITGGGVSANSVTLSTAYTLNGGTLTLTGGAAALTSTLGGTIGANVTISGAAGTITSNAGTLALNGTLSAGNLGLTFAGAGNTTFANAITNTTTLTMNGSGILTLGGATNGFTTATISAGTITGSTLSLSGGGTALNSTGNTTVNSNVTFTNAGGSTIQSTNPGQLLSLGGTVNASNFGLTFAGAGNTTFANAITSTTTLTMNGGGTLTLAGTNTFNSANSLTISAGTITGGTLSLGGGATALTGTNAAGTVNVNSAVNFTAAGGSTITSTNGGATLSLGGAVNAGGFGLTIAGAGATTFAQGITNGGVLTKNGNTTLTLTGNNAFSSAVINAGTITGGTLTLSGGGGTTLQSTATSAVNSNVTFTNAGGSAVQSQAGTLSLGGTVNASNLALTFTGGGGNTTLANAITNGNTLTMNGTGILTLAGANIFSTGVTINNGNITGGTLNVGGASAVINGGLGVINSGIVATAPNTTFTSNAGAMNISGGINAQNNSLIFTGSNAATVQVVGITNGTTLIKNGGGTLSLFTANTLTGGVTLNSGGLAINNVGALGAGTFTITAGSIDANVAPIVNAGNNALNLNGDFTFNGTNNLNLGNGAVSVAVAGPTRTITLAANTLTIGGNITFSAPATTLATTGAGNLNIGGTVTGNFTVGGPGTVTAGAPTSFGSGTAMTVNGGAFELNGNNITLGSLAGSGGSVQNTAVGAVNLTLAGTNVAPVTYSGLIQDTGGTPLSLIKTGAGQQNLASANSYRGTTTITGGTLSVAVLANGGTNSGIGQSSNAAANLVLDGGTLAYTGGAQSTDRLFTVTSNSGTILANGTGALTFSNTGIIAMPGAGNRTLTLSGTGTGINVMAAQINDPVGGGTTTVNVPAGGSQWLLTNNLNGFGGLTTVAAGETLLVGANGALGGGGNAGNGTVVNAGGTLQLQAGVNVGVPAGPGSEWLTINGSGVANKGALTVQPGGNTAGWGGPITVGSTNSVITAGNGNTLNLSGGIIKNNVNLIIGNTAAGATTATSGTVNITGTGINSPGAIGGTFNSDVGYTAGTTNLGATSAYSGDTWLFNGAVVNANVVGALPSTAADGGTAAQRAGLILDADNVGNFSVANYPTPPAGAIGGTGGSTLNVNANQAVQFIASAPGATTSKIVIANNSTLTIGTTAATLGFVNNTNYAGQINGGGGVVTLIKDGTNTQILSGANLYLGQTNVTGGTLQLGNAQALGDTGAGTVVSAGATLDLGGQNVGVEAVTINGTGDAVAINGALGNSGATANLAGVLTIGAGGANVGGTGNINLNGQVTGGALTKTFADTVVLTNSANNYTTTTITTGVLQVGAGGASGVLGTGAVTDNATLTFNRSDTLTVNNAIGGSGIVNQGVLGGPATGITVLAGGNSYGGVTNVIVGTLRVANASALGAGTNVLLTDGTIVSSGATLDLNGTAVANEAVSISGTGVGGNGALINSNATGASLGGGLTLGAASTIGGVGDISLNGGIVAGAFAVTKIGNDTVFLTSNTNTSTTTTVNAGNIQLGDATVGGSAAGALGTGAVTLTTGTTNLNINRSNAVTIANAISGAGNVNQNGSGVTTLSGPNNYTGQTNVNAGTLQLGNVQALGTTAGSTVVANGATLDLNGLAIGAEPVTLQGTGVGGLGALINSNATGASLAGPVNLAATTTVGGAANSTITLGGAVNGAGGLTVGVAGTKTTLILNGTSAYGGATTVVGNSAAATSSTLLVGNGAALNGTAVTVQSGATLGGGAAGVGTITGAVTIAGGGNLTPGNAGVSAGVLSVGPLTLNAGTNLNFDLGTAGVVGLPNNDLVNVNGALTLDGNLNVTPGGGFTSGSYRLFNYTGGLTNNTVDAITGVGAGFTATVVTAVPGQVNLLVLSNGVGPVQFWDGGPGAVANDGAATGGNGTWNNFTNNWAGAPAGTGANAGWQNGTAVFGAPAGTVSLGETINAQGLIFGNSGYVINSGVIGATLNLVGQNPAVAGVPFISVTNAGDIATINAQITNIAPVPFPNGLTSTGAGTLVLANAGNTYTGGTTITGGGTVSISSDGNLGALPGAFGVNDVNLNNGTLQATATFTLNANRQVVLAAAGGGISVTGPDTLTIGAVNQITGAGGLTKLGTGILNLTAANNYVGGTIINGGTVQVNNDNNLGNVAGGIAFGNNAVLKTMAGITSARAITLNAGGGTVDTNTFNSTLSGVIGGGANQFTKTGLGTLTLTATETYTGGTNINGGTLQVGNGATGNLAAASLVTVNSGGTLAVNLANAGALATTNITNNAGGTVSGINAAGTQTIGAAITGAGDLNQNGLGTTILTGANTYTGTTTVIQGTLQIGDGVTAGTSIANSVSTKVNGGATLALNLANGGVFTNSVTNDGTINGINALGVTQTASGNIIGAGVLNQNGAGITILTGVNLYAGQTTVNAGILVAGNASALGNIGAGTLVNNGGSLMIANGILTNVEPLTINGPGAPAVAGFMTVPGALTQSLNGSSTFNGPILVASNSTISSNGTGTLTLNAAINKSDVVLTLTGGGRIVVNAAITGNVAGFNDDLVVDAVTTDLNAANTYLGPTFIRNNGVLNANAGNALPTLNGRTSITIDGAGASSLVLNNGFNQAIASLQSALGAASVNLNVNTLTIGFGNAPDTNGTASANFAGVISGTGGITKDETSLQILSGLNTYTGATLVSGGTLQAGISDAGGLGATTNGAFGNKSAVTVNANAILDIAGFNVGIGSLAGGGAASFVQSNGGAGTLTTGGDNTSTNYAGVIRNGTGTLSLIKLGTGTQTLSGTAANTYTGLTTVNAGELDLNKTAGVNAVGGNLTIGDGAGGANSDIVKLLASNQIIDTSVVLIHGSSGKLDLNGFNETIAGFGDTGAVVVNGSSVNLGAGTLTFGADNIGRTFSGAITGAGGNLIKNGTGIQTLAGTTTANTFSGLTTVNAGELDLNKTAGTLAIGGNLTIGDGAGGANSDIVKLLASNQIIDTSVVLIHGSSGKLDLNGFSETIAGFGDTGAVVVNGSSVNLGAGTLTFGADNVSRTFSGAITGAGGNLIKNGTGTETLAGTTTANTFSGLTTVNAGELDLNKTAGTLAIGGNLTIGDGAGPGIVPTANSDIVKLLASNQIIDTSVVQINATTGRLDLNGNSETVGSIASTGAFTLGGSTINLGAGTLTTGGLNTSTTYSGVIGGAGGNLTKVGTGTFTLSGLNTYTGATLVNAGTLKAGSTQAFGVNSAVTVAGPGTLDLAGNSNSIGSLADVAGVGGIVQSTVGPATLTTGGDNTSTSFFGTVQDGVGPLSLVKNGLGTQTLGGVNTYTGSTTVNAGTLLAFSTQAFGVNSAAIVNAGGTLDINGFSNSIGSLAGTAGGIVQSSFGPATLTTGGDNTSTTYAGTVQNGTGPLAFVKNGTGFQTLSGPNTYTGGTTLNAGTLGAGNTKAFGSGNLTVNGGTLRTVGGPLIVDVGGGNINVNGGTVVSLVGGTTPGVNHDQLKTTGTAGFNSTGGTLALVQQNGYLLAPGDKVNLAIATGGVVGGTAVGRAVPNANVTGLSAFSNTPLLVPTVNLYPTTVTLEAMQGSFAGLNGQTNQGIRIAYTPNQLAVATALDSVARTINNKTGIFKELNYLDTQSLSTLTSNLDKIAPEELTSVFQISKSLANVQTANIQRRLDDIRSSSAAVKSDFGVQVHTGSHKGSKEIAPASDERWGTFFTGSGEFTHIGSTTNAAGFNLDSGGVTAGIDYRLTGNFAVGLSLGYANTTGSLANGGKIDVDGGRLGLYATYFTGGFYADASVTGGLSSYKTRRTTPNNTIATGSPDGSEINVLIATGYDWKKGGFTYGPTASFQYTNMNLDRFTETGTFAPLTIAGKSADSERIALGFHASYDWKMGSIIVRPEARAAWQHEFGDTTYSLTSNFATLGGNAFTVAGPATGRDSLLVGAGFSILLSDRFSIYAFYDGELLRTNYSSNNVSAGLRLRF